VFSVGGKMGNIEKIKVPVEVEEVKNRNKEYFPQNKTYISKLCAENLIYLDADTIVLNSIDKIIEKNKCEFTARRDSFDKSCSDEKYEEWKNILSKYESKMGPYFNSGFVVFRRKSQEKLNPCWNELCHKEWEKGGKSEFSKFQYRGTIEQTTLSVKALSVMEDMCLMSEHHHVYGWEKAPLEVGSDAIVYHTGSRGQRHIKYASAVARGRDLNFNVPLISRALNPLFIRLQGYDLAYRVKHFLFGF
jgi:hypothetical protein